MKLNFGNVATIILAAGEGTRFGQGRPSKIQKVLMEVGGQPMIDYTLELLEELNLGKIIIVIGHGASQVRKHLGRRFTYAVQQKRLGTLDAASCGLKKVGKTYDTVLVVNGDDSFGYKPQTLVKIFEKHQNSKAVLTFVTLEKENPQGLGRVLRNSQGEVEAIVEEKDATGKEKEITEINDGLYVFDKKWLVGNISKVEKSKVSGEFYLVDLVKIARIQKEKIETYKLPNPSEWFGVNTPAELVLANQ